jgi:hypothetical protein
MKGLWTDLGHRQPVSVHQGGGLVVVRPVKEPQGLDEIGTVQRRVPMKMRSVVWMTFLTVLLCFSMTAVVAAQPPPKAISDRLDEVSQNWDKVLPAVERFVVLPAFNNEAVRDNETGLVWERSPATSTENWESARFACVNKNVGGRTGWRSPSIIELASLNDPSVSPGGPTLPSGHPFTNVFGAVYWSATTNAASPVSAWFMNFFLGIAFAGTKTDSFLVWCVRGGMNADQY